MDDRVEALPQSSIDDDDCRVTILAFLRVIEDYQPVLLQLAFPGARGV